MTQPQIAYVLKFFRDAMSSNTRLWSRLNGRISTCCFSLEVCVLCHDLVTYLSLHSCFLMAGRSQKHQHEANYPSSSSSSPIPVYNILCSDSVNLSWSVIKPPAPVMTLGALRMLDVVLGYQIC